MPNVLPGSCTWSSGTVSDPQGLAGRSSIMSSANPVGTSRSASGADGQVGGIGSFFQRGWRGPRIEDAEGGGLARDEVRLWPRLRSLALRVLVKVAHGGVLSIWPSEAQVLPGTTAQSRREQRLTATQA